jgi:hypothetical protein
MAKRYIRINYQDSPSTATPLNAANLNKMDKGIKDCDDAIGDLELLKTSIKTDLVAAINEQNDNLALQGWTNLTPINNWTATGLRYKKHMNVVHLQGVIQTQESTSNPIFASLPSGFRPSQELDFSVTNYNTGTPLRVIVTTSGELRCANYLGVFTSAWCRVNVSFIVD